MSDQISMPRRGSAGRQAADPGRLQHLRQTVSRRAVARVRRPGPALAAHLRATEPDGAAEASRPPIARRGTSLR